MGNPALVLGIREFRSLKGYTVSDTNRSLADIEKAEARQAHADAMNTGQFAKAITEEVQKRAAAAVAAMKKDNAKNAQGFPEDAPKYGRR